MGMAEVYISKKSCRKKLWKLSSILTWSEIISLTKSISSFPHLYSEPKMLLEFVDVMGR